MKANSHSFSDTPLVTDVASCEPHGESCLPVLTEQRLITPLILTMGALLLGGCAGGITGINLDSSTRTVCDPAGTVCGIADSDTAYFQVLGQGKCDTIGVKYGDGAESRANGNFHLFNPALIAFPYQYTTQHPVGPKAWPGPKTVHAYSIANCTGEARMQVNVLRERTNTAGQIEFTPTVRVGMAPTATVCNVAPNTRPVRKGSTILITEVPGGPLMNFGCASDGCTNNTAGNSGATHPGFPFASLRRHSLVLRIVSASGETQVEQGQPVTRFVARVDGPLEFCANDTVLTDNSGAWAMDVLVDETTVP